MRYWILAATVACGTKTTGDSGTSPVDTTTTDTGTTPPDPRDAFTCFAEVAIDDDGNGESGFDGLDADHPTWLMYSDRDLSGDGRPEYQEIYTRDADGNVLRWERVGLFSASYEQTYDERGNLLSYDYDDGSDGTVEYHSEYAWDLNDEVVYYAYSDDGDAVLDYRLVYTRDAEGYRDTAEESVDGDEVFDNIYSYFRDDQNREVRVERRDALGVLDLVFVATFTDPVVRTGFGTLDEGDDGTTDGYIEFTSDAEDRRTYRAEDSAPYDAVFETVENWAYDAAGNIVEYVSYDENDGNPFDYELIQAFDGLGRQLLLDEAIAAQDGSFAAHEITTWTFGGTCP